MMDEGKHSTSKVPAEDYLLQDKSLTFEEYEARVAAHFFKYQGRSETTEVYLKSEEAQQIIRTNYVDYVNPQFHLGGCEPEATAHCLHMMY